MIRSMSPLSQTISLVKITSLRKTNIKKFT